MQNLTVPFSKEGFVQELLITMRLHGGSVIMLLIATARAGVSLKFVCRSVLCQASFQLMLCVQETNTDTEKRGIVSAFQELDHVEQLAVGAAGVVTAALAIGGLAIGADLGWQKYCDSHRCPGQKRESRASNESASKGKGNDKDKGKGKGKNQTKGNED